MKIKCDECGQTLDGEHPFCWSCGARVSDQLDSLVSSFRMLALGARFQYPESEKVWVKLSNDGTVAEWDEANKCTGWVGQSVCCFDENDDFEKKVNVC